MKTSCFWSHISIALNSNFIKHIIGSHGHGGHHDFISHWQKKYLVTVPIHTCVQNSFYNNKINICTCQADHYLYTVVACLFRIEQSKINHTQQYRENVTSLLQQILTINRIVSTLANISTGEELLYVLFWKKLALFSLTLWVPCEDVLFC